MMKSSTRRYKVDKRITSRKSTEDLNSNTNDNVLTEGSTMTKRTKTTACMKVDNESLVGSSYIFGKT